jgi:hypothetical protein
MDGDEKGQLPEPIESPVLYGLWIMAVGIFHRDWGL